MAFLIIIDGEGSGNVYPLGQKVVNIGRAPENDIVINDTQISRRHAQVFLESGHWRVLHTSTTNKTYLNDAPIRETVLVPGDKLRMGKVIFIFQLEEPTRVDLEKLQQSPFALPRESPLGLILALRPLQEITPPTPIVGDDAGLRDSAATKPVLFSADLNRIADLFAAGLSRIDFLQQSLALLLRIFPCSRGAILLLDSQSGNLKTATLQPADKTPSVLGGADPLALHACREKTGIIVSRPRLETKKDEKMEMVMAVPLWDGEKILGALLLADPPPDREFFQDTLEAGWAIGRMVATGLNLSKA